MADDANGATPGQDAPLVPQSGPPSSAAPSTLAAPDSSPANRHELIAKARSFLSSPQAQYQDAATKQEFLRGKGLNAEEIDGLLTERPVHRPLVPPRTYPQPPPSNLPRLLLGMLRLLSWLMGGSLALIAVYYRFLLPRIALTSAARHSIKAHQITLLAKLNVSLAELKRSQKDSFSVLPQPEPYKEPEELLQCHSVEDVLKLIEAQKVEVKDVPPVTFLRCAVESLLGTGNDEDQQPTTDELFRHLEDQISWFSTEDGLLYEEKLWETLNTCPLFSSTVTAIPHPEGEQKVVRWAYSPATPTPPPQLMASLTNLKETLPKEPPTKERLFQRTLQALSDFTGYISTQVYLPYRPPISGSFGVTANPPPSTAEEDMKREIRALKGLVLNRRSFMASIPRPYGAATPPTATTTPLPGQASGSSSGQQVT